MTRILFLVRALTLGGAERQLTELVQHLAPGRFKILVLTYYSQDAAEYTLRRSDSVELQSLGKRGRWDVLGFLWRLYRAARTFRPQIMHGYLGGANEVALLIGRLTGAKVVWGLRASNMDFSRYDWLSGVLFRLGAWCSAWTDLIIVNSHAGREHHVRCGYAGERMLTIHNGIDGSVFGRSPEARERIRSEWNVRDDEILVGLVGRIDPMKDHATFLRAAAALAGQAPQARFVCVGTGPPRYWQEMRSLASSLGLDGRLTWAGARQDMPAVYNALDVLCSSSAFGEGFSNVVAEGMACGIPCVVTDVGDSARIVGDTGTVVPPGDADAMMQAVRQLLMLPAQQRRDRGNRARQRVVEHFPVEKMVAATQAAFNDLLKPAH
jgi:glycosyltransferase involved in cell wall biosynthesis